MFKAVFATMVMVALLAVPAIADASLAGTNWRFIEVAGRTIPADIHTQIGFGKDGMASGDSGCNSFYGAYGSDGSVLSFSNMGWTKMFCPGPGEEMGVEGAIQLALENTRSFAITAGKLQLLGSDGAILARLEMSPLK